MVDDRDMDAINALLEQYDIKLRQIRLFAGRTNFYVSKISFRGHPAQDPNATKEMLLRTEWWMNHGLPGKCRPYGDDGEMQCCGVDFRRTPFDELQERVNELRLRRVVEALESVQD